MLRPRDQWLCHQGMFPGEGTLHGVKRVVSTVNEIDSRVTWLRCHHVIHLRSISGPWEKDLLEFHHVYCNLILDHDSPLIESRHRGSVTTPSFPIPWRYLIVNVMLTIKIFLGQRTKCEADTRPLARCIYITWYTPAHDRINPMSRSKLLDLCISAMTGIDFPTLLVTGYMVVIRWQYACRYSIL